MVSYLENINSIINIYQQNEDRKRWIDNGKKTAFLIQKLTKAIIKRGKFTWEDFNAIFLTLIVSQRIRTQTKIEKIKKLNLESNIEKEIISELDDFIGCWGSGTFSFRFILQEKKYVEALFSLLDNIITNDTKEETDNAIMKFIKMDIKGLQTGIMSPIFYCLRPTLYPIINKPSTSALSKFTNNVFSRKLVNYLEEAKYFQDFKEKYNFKDDYRDLDTFLYMQLEGYLEKEDEKLQIDVDDPEFELISLPADLEITLRKHLALNSHIIEKDLELISEDKPIINSSRNRPDLVFRKANDNILIIETKKDKPGRKTVSQIVDYIAEAKKAYNKTTKEIEAIIICHEAHIDSSVVNALDVLPNISLKTYSFEFKIEDYKN